MMRNKTCLSADKLVIFLIAFTFLHACSASDRYARNDHDMNSTYSSTPSEYDLTGRLIVDSLRTGDSYSFNKLLNKSIFLARAFQGISNDIVSDSREQFISVLDEAGIIMTKNLEINTKLTFVKARRVGTEHRVLIRVDRKEQGLSFIDFVLARDSNGQIKITDWYDYAQGQLYSELIRQSLMFILPDNDSLFAQILGESWIDRESITIFSEMSVLAGAGRYNEWLNHYRTLPERLKYSRIVLVTRVLIASASGVDSEYISALKDVGTYIGDDPSLSLMLLDHYLNERDYYSAHRALDRLNSLTGGDAAIDLLRANIYLTEKKYDRSLQYARLAIKEDSSIEDAYWTLLAGSVYSGEYKTAIETLRQLEIIFGYTFDPNHIAALKGYERFAASSFFADWKLGMIP